MDLICPTDKLKTAVNAPQNIKPIIPIAFIGWWIDHDCLPQNAPTINPKTTFTAEIKTAILQPPKIPWADPDANRVPLINDSKPSRARSKK